MPGQVKAAFEIGTATIGVLGTLGLPVDIFGDDGPDIAAKLDELEATIQTGFFNNLENQAILKVGEALELSSQAWAEFKNDGLSPEREAALLQNAANGLTNMNNALDTLLKIDGTLTPSVVQEIYPALAFSMTVLIRTATSLATGEKTGTGYNHGGVITYESQISTAIEHLESARDIFKEEYTFTVSPPVPFETRNDPISGAIGGQINFRFTHNIPLENNLAFDFWSGFIRQFDYPEVNFADSDVMDVFENLVVFDDPQLFGFRDGSLLGIPTSFGPLYSSLAESRYLFREEAMRDTIDDYTYFFLTGLKSPTKPVGAASQFILDFYEEGVDGLGDLIDSAIATIDGDIVTYNGLVREQAEQGTAGGDFLKGSARDDVMRGFDDNDYLLGNAGNDEMFGGAGSDIYFGGPGNDRIIDTGVSSDDFDVAIFEGLSTDYKYYQDGSLIRVVKIDEISGKKFIEFDILSGIEAVKFDDEVYSVDNLPSPLLALPAPFERPEIAISDDTGIVGDQYTSDGTLKFSGTTVPNSPIDIYVRDASSNDDSIGGGVKVGSTHSDSDGEWDFNYIGTVLSEGRNSIWAEAINDAGVSSGKSQLVFETRYTVDKTGPTVEYAILSSSSEDPTLVLAGDTVTLDFEASERLLFDLGDPDSPDFSGIPGIAGGPIVPIMPIVTIGGLVADVVENNIFFGQINTYQATVTLDASVLPGETLEFLIEMIDRAGNPGSASILKDRDGSTPGLFSVGGTPTVAAPDFTVLSDDTGVSESDLITSDGTLLISGTAEADSTVELFLDGSSLGSVTATAGGAWSFDKTGSDLAEGRYTLGANATNAGGDVSGTKRTALEIDKTAPVIESASLSSTNSIGSVAVSGDVITLTFSLDSEIEGLPVVTIAGASAVVVDLKRGDYRATVTLDDPAPQGAVTFQISATDSAGNVGSANAVTDDTSISVNVSPVVTDLPGTVTVTEDLASDLDLSALTLSDVDLTDELTVVLSASAGTMAAVDGTGVVVTANGTAALTFVGTAAAIDTYLNTASAVQYTGAQHATGTAAATLTLTGDDGSGEVTFGTVNIDITNVNDAPTGAVTITGTATQGQTLTADTSTITDDDGLDTLTTQWLRGTDVIIGATATTYTLRNVDVGAAISVRVSYTDQGGTNEAITSAQTSAVIGTANNAPMGRLVVNGFTDEGSELTVVSFLEDEDGLGTLGFQWLRDGDVVLGETGNTYTVGADDVGARISVSASYTDGRGNDETVISPRTIAIAERVDIRGTPQPDILNGTLSPELIEGLEANDTITGGGGSDRLFGGDGDDIIFGDSFELSYALSEANQVFRLYQATFNRTPDEGGHRLWTSELLTGAQSLAEVRQSFVNSREFRNKYVGLDDGGFVKKLYVNVFDRDFDNGTVSQTEIDGWTKLITETFTRADVVNGFSESRELINKSLNAANALAVDGNPAAWTDDIYRLYRATLDRDPDKGGFGDWAEQLSGGRPFEDVILGFTNSREFNNVYGALSDPEDFVKLLYNNVLDRDFDLDEVTQNEVSSWTSLLSETFTRADIVKGFSQSREFMNATKSDVIDWVRAQGVDDVIDGGAGTNTLAGGVLVDAFVFNQVEAGTHNVLDLEAWDYIDLNGFGYETVAAARAQMTQIGNAIVFKDQGTEITFERATLSALEDDVFLV